MNQESRVKSQGPEETPLTVSGDWENTMSELRALRKNYPVQMDAIKGTEWDLET